MSRRRRLVQRQRSRATVALKRSMSAVGSKKRINLERHTNEPDTRQFQLNPDQTSSPDSTLMEVKAEEETKADHHPRPKNKPGKSQRFPRGQYGEL